MGEETLFETGGVAYDGKHFTRYGKVLFGGADEKDMEPEKLMKNISMVFQDVYLFPDGHRFTKAAREKASSSL